MRRWTVGLALAAALLPAAGANAAGAPRDQLVRTGSVTSFGTKFERYQQRVGGVPVLGGKVVVTDARGAVADIRLDRSRRGLRAPGRATVTRGVAIAAARRATRASDLRGAPRAALAILPSAGRARLVWRVLLPAGNPRASYEVLVDARSASILRIRDRLRHLGRDTVGRAAVFMPNPVTTQGSRAGLADRRDADSALLSSLRIPVALRRLQGRRSCLEGRWVHVTLPSGEVCRPPNADFSSVTRSDDAFEALMAYVHIDGARAYLQSLGFTNLLNRSLPVIVNADAEDNSSYDPSERSISFGRGGVDDAEDGDVIVHEYGHAIQDAQVESYGETTEGGAMGEGFSDYLQAAVNSQRAPNGTFNPCMGEWDSLDLTKPEPLQCLTRTDLDLAANQVGPGTECDAELHCAGEAWSGALWRIRALIGGTTADRLVVQSHYSLTPSADFTDGSVALIVADRALYGGVHERVLREVLIARGLLDPTRLFLRVGGKLPSMRTVRRTKRFRLTIAVSEPATVRLSGLIEGGPNGAQVATKARSVRFRTAGRRRVTFELTRAGLRRLRARRRAVLRILAEPTFATGRALPVVQARRRLR